MDLKSLPPELLKMLSGVDDGQRCLFEGLDAPDAPDKIDTIHAASEWALAVMKFYLFSGTSMFLNIKHAEENDIIGDDTDGAPSRMVITSDIIESLINIVKELNGLVKPLEQFFGEKKSKEEEFIDIASKALFEEEGKIAPPEEDKETPLEEQSFNDFDKF